MQNCGKLVFFNKHCFLWFSFFLLLTIVGCGSDHQFPQYQLQKPGELLLMVDPTAVNKFKQKGFTGSRSITKLFERNIPLSISNSINYKYPNLLWKTKVKNKTKSNTSYPVLAKISVPDQVDPSSVLGHLQKIPFILSAEPNYYSHFMDVPSTYLKSNEDADGTGDGGQGTTDEGGQNGQTETESLTYIPTEKGYYQYQQFIYDLLGIPQAWNKVFSRWSPDPAGECPSEKYDAYICDVHIGVAVLDSGVAIYHEELVNRLLVNEKERELKDEEGNYIKDKIGNPVGGRPGVDDDNNGYVDDVNGVSVNDSDEVASPYDENSCLGEDYTEWDDDKKYKCYLTVGHGTHIAGIIAAEAGNGESGMTGICWNCRILPIKITDQTGLIPDDNIIKSLDYIADLNASDHPDQVSVNIANLSVGKMLNSLTIESAIRRISQHVLIVAAASNDDTEQPSYPAALPEVLSVSAIGGPDESTAMRAMDSKNKSTYLQKAGFSNFGNHIDIVAPGMNIWSTSSYQFNPTDANNVIPCKGESFCAKSGTSQAAPFVSAIAGMVWAYFYWELECDPAFENKPEDQIYCPTKAALPVDYVRDYLIDTADGVSLYKAGYNGVYGQEKSGDWYSKNMLGAGIVRADRALNAPGLYPETQNTMGSNFEKLEDLHYQTAKELGNQRFNSGCMFLGVEKQKWKEYLLDDKGPKPPFLLIFGWSVLVLWLKKRSSVSKTGSVHG